jgi:hypothetical protein
MGRGGSRPSPPRSADPPPQVGEGEVLALARRRRERVPRRGGRGHKINSYQPLTFMESCPRWVPTVRNGGPMSRVCRSCSNRVQRLQEVWSNTPISSGSRKRAPGALRPQRGYPQRIHNRRTGLSALECRRPWPCKCKLCGLKSLRFLVRLQAEHPLFSSTVATGLKPGREQPSPYSPKARR